MRFLTCKRQYSLHCFIRSWKEYWKVFSVFFLKFLERPCTRKTHLTYDVMRWQVFAPVNTNCDLRACLHSFKESASLKAEKKKTKNHHLIYVPWTLNYGKMEKVVVSVLNRSTNILELVRVPSKWGERKHLHVRNITTTKHQLHTIMLKRNSFQWIPTLEIHKLIFTPNSHIFFSSCYMCFPHVMLPLS